MKIQPFSAAAAFVIGLSSCQTGTPPQPDRFAQADENGDGELSGGEVSDFIVTRIFIARDRSGDGFITKDEWNVDMPAAEEAQFEQRDADKDGKVSLAEAKAHARKAGTYSKDILQADTNGDGKVTREEATAFYGATE